MCTICRQAVTGFFPKRVTKARIEPHLSTPVAVRRTGCGPLCLTPTVVHLLGQLIWQTCKQPPPPRHPPLPARTFLHTSTTSVSHGRGRSVAFSSSRSIPLSLTAPPRPLWRQTRLSPSSDQTVVNPLESTLRPQCDKVEENRSKHITG